MPSNLANIINSHELTTSHYSYLFHWTRWISSFSSFFSRQRLNRSHFSCSREPIVCAQLSHSDSLCSRKKYLVFRDEKSVWGLWFWWWHTRATQHCFERKMEKNGHWHQEVKTRWLFIAFITFAYRRLSQFNAVFFYSPAHSFNFMPHILLFFLHTWVIVFFDVIYLVGFAYRYLLFALMCLWSITSTRYSSEKLTLPAFSDKCISITMWMWLKNDNLCALFISVFRKTIDYTMLVIFIRLFALLHFNAFLLFWVYLLFSCLKSYTLHVYLLLNV